jgi:hypothetical protein
MHGEYVRHTLEHDYHGQTQDLYYVRKLWGDPINKHIDIIESQASEIAIVQYFGCINGRTLQTIRAKKIQGFIIFFDEPMVRAIAQHV